MHQFEKCEKCHHSVIAETLSLCCRCMFDICAACRVRDGGRAYCESCFLMRSETKTKTEKETNHD